MTLGVLDFTPLYKKSIRVMYSHCDPSIQKSDNVNYFVYVQFVAYWFNIYLAIFQLLFLGVIFISFVSSCYFRRICIFVLAKIYQFVREYICLWFILYVLCNSKRNYWFLLYHSRLDDDLLLDYFVLYCYSLLIWSLCLFLFCWIGTLTCFQWGSFHMFLFLKAKSTLKKNHWLITQ